MASVHHFRSAFNGFNREDVVQYIEYMNNQHAAKLEQLTAQLREAQSQPQDPELQARLEAAEARCALLEEELAKKETPTTPTEEELEAYRRAEQAERLARERAHQIYTRANAVLADVTLKAESVSQQVTAQLQQYEQSVIQTKDALQ